MIFARLKNIGLDNPGWIFWYWWLRASTVSCKSLRFKLKSIEITMKCHRLRHPRNTAQMSRPVLVLNLENFKRCVASRSPAATFLGMARSLRNWSEMAIRIISGQAHYFQKQNPDVDHCRSHMITHDHTTGFLSWHPAQISCKQRLFMAFPSSWFGQCLTWLTAAVACWKLTFVFWPYFAAQFQIFSMLYSAFMVFLMFVWKGVTL